MSEIYEATLSQTQCAEIALGMLAAYQDYLKKPTFSVLTFDQWLREVIRHDPQIHLPIS